MHEDWKSGLKGQKLGTAFSSLTEFSCETDGATGVLIRAIDSDRGPAIEIKTVPNDELPKDSDAVCRVDWRWIAGSVVSDVSASSNVVKLQLSPAGPLTISVQTWQGKAFLAFQPYRAPQQ